MIQRIEGSMEQTALVKREEFGVAQTTAALETAASAIAARERAATEARYIMAERHKRDIESFRVAILRECDRPGFAEVARYKKPIGGSVIEGPSIRFAEAALRCFGNVYAEQSIVFEDDMQRIVRVSVTDLERNISYPTEVVVKKTVERKQKREGMEVLGERKNTKGDTVYLIRATEDDIQNKQNALISKALRNNGLRLIPGDVIEECMNRVLQTQRTEDKKDPDAAKRRVIDAFAALGIVPTELSVFLGHSLDKIQPAELVELRAAYSAIKDGEAYWGDLLRAKGIESGAEMQKLVASAKIAELSGGKPADAAQQIQRSARSCKLCGGSGHDSRNCPTKSEPTETVPFRKPKTDSGAPMIPTVDDLPAMDDDAFSNVEVVMFGGKLWERNEDNTNWQLAKQ